jgi:hypothetical protein
LNGLLGKENAMNDRYTVFGMYDEDGELQQSGLLFEDAFEVMMKRAGCSYKWVHEIGLTRIEVRYDKSLPETYECVRDLKSPYFQSRVPNEALARREIMRSFLRTGLCGIHIRRDEDVARIDKGVESGFQKLSPEPEEASQSV